jgi:hypothetical protein
MRRPARPLIAQRSSAFAECVIAALLTGKPAFGFTYLSAIYPLLQTDDDGVTRRFSDRLADVCLYWQLVCAITYCHERTLESVAVNRPSDLYEAPSSKEID